MSENYLQHADHFARILQSREIAKDLNSNSSDTLKKTSENKNYTENNEEETSSPALNVSD